MALLQAQAPLRAVQRRRPPRRSPRPWRARATKVRRGHGMHDPSRPRAYVRRRRSQRGRRAQHRAFSASRLRRRFRARRHRPRARGRRSAARARRRRDAKLGWRHASNRWRRPRKHKPRVRVGKPLQDELRAGGDAAERRRRGASDGHTASTACFGHAGRASSSTSDDCGIFLFLCKKSADRCRNQSTKLRSPLVDFHTGASASDFDDFPGMDLRPPVQKVAFRDRSSTCSPSLELVSTASCPRKERHDRILTFSEFSNLTHRLISTQGRRVVGRSAAASRRGGRPRLLRARPDRESCPPRSCDVATATATASGPGAGRRRPSTYAGRRA